MATVLTVGSLFSGVGGMDLGLERAGMRIAWQIEIDPYCTRVLERHWPGVKRYGDIRDVDPAELEPVDVVAGGPPCQPVSVAGKRRGAEDDRWLWGEALRVVAGVRPRWCLFENPAGFVTLGLDLVLSHLEALGYSCWAAIVPACAVGAPHRRDRVWVVAYAAGKQVHGKHEGSVGPRKRRWNTLGSRQEATRQKDGEASHDCIGGCGQDVAHATGAGQLRAEQLEDSRARSRGPSTDDADQMCPLLGQDVAYPKGHAARGLPVRACEEDARPACNGEDVAHTCGEGLAVGAGIFCNAREECATPERAGGRYSESRVGRVPDGPANRLDGHRWPAPFGCEQHGWEPPRLAGGKVPYRRQRLQALGNAVVPQVVEEIGRAIIEADALWKRSERRG